VKETDSPVNPAAPNVFRFIYEKQNEYKGTLYLHGWAAKPFLSHWYNVSLRRYDDVLPHLEPGDIVTFYGEYLDHSGPFATIYLQEIINIIWDRSTNRENH
jgi:hypothetical protein